MNFVRENLTAEVVGDGSQIYKFLPVQYCAERVVRIAQDEHLAARSERIGYTVYVECPTWVACPRHGDLDNPTPEQPRDFEERCIGGRG